MIRVKKVISLEISIFPLCMSTPDAKILIDDGTTCAGVVKLNGRCKDALLELKSAVAIIDLVESVGLYQKSTEAGLLPTVKVLVGLDIFPVPIF